MQSVLISGASVAGPVLAYWLRRYGFEVTVVERTVVLRHGLGGHAVDLFASAAEVTRRMGLWDQIVAARTRNDVLVLERDGKRPVEVNIARLSAGIAANHVEILRGELTRLLYDATRADAEYLFGDSITSLHDDGSGVDVTFEHAPPRRFDLVIGADGMHSGVRTLAFGPEEPLLRPLGGYLAVYSMPDVLNLGTRMHGHLRVGSMVGAYGVRQTGQARAMFLFRKDVPLRYDYRDKAAQKQLIRDEFAAYGWQVPTLLEYLDPADDFYFDSITQITLDSWHRGRIGLVGDAGYCPGPAVGGGTSLAVVTAYVLAGELAAARSDLPSGLRNYENKIRHLVELSRHVGPKAMSQIIPASPLALRLVPFATRALVRLPLSFQRLIWSQSGVGKALASMPLPDYADLVRA